MSIRRHLVTAGMTLWSKERQKMCHTRMSREAWFEVKIIEVHEDGCTVSWNGNRPRKWHWRSIEKLYRNKRPSDVLRLL